jgi:hypothetical protein
MVTFVLVNEGNMRAREGRREGASGEGVREERGKEGRKLLGKLFVKFKGKAISTRGAARGRIRDSLSYFLRGDGTVKMEGVMG